MTDDEATISGLQERIRALLTAQITLHRTIASLELDKKRLERERDELRSAVAALLAPTPERKLDNSNEPLPPYGR
jgi:chromosome segregation ATPase